MDLSTTFLFLIWRAPVSEMMATAGGGRNNDGMETSIVDKDRNPVVPEV